MNDVREAAEFGWNVLSAVLGSVLTLVIYAFRMGGRLEKLATKEEVAETLKSYARKDQLDEIKADITEIKSAQYRADAKHDKHHAQIIEALLRGRE